MYMDGIRIIKTEISRILFASYDEYDMKGVVIGRGDCKINVKNKKILYQPHLLIIIKE